MYQLFSRRYWVERAIPCHFEFRDPQPPFPMHTHDFHEIVVVYSGTALHLTPQGQTEIQAGEVLSIKPGQTHGFKKINNLVLMNILVQPAFLGSENFDLNTVPGYAALFEPISKMRAESMPISVFRLNQFQLFEVRALIESMKKEIAQHNIGYIVQTTTLFIQLLIFLLRVYENRNFAAVQTISVSERLVAYVEKNFRNNISMQDLIEVSGLSESSILRAFKHMTGYPPFVYQNRQRMFAAINDLVYSNKQITQIALDLGFNDSNYFSRIFKKFIQMSPSEYREQFGE